jgi:hypothetical protein
MMTLHVPLQVNQFASLLVKQLVKGDAFLTHPSCSAVDARDLLQSRNMQLTQPFLPRNTEVTVYGQVRVQDQALVPGVAN